MSKIVEVLPNGLTLVGLGQEHHQSVVAMVAVRVGSRDETDGLRGAAHFIEHMRFKRTKAMSTPLAVAKFVDSRGGEHNAWTEKEMTAFHVQMAGADGRAAVEFLHEVVANGSFRRSDYELEKQVIMDEVSGYGNDPDQVLYQCSDGQIFAGTGLEHPVPGSLDDVKRLTLDGIKAFHKAYYVPENMIVILAGDVDHRAFSDARKKFGGIKGGGALPARKAPGENSRFLRVVLGNTDRMHVLITFSGPSCRSSDRRAASVMGTALGGMSTSRLVQNLREKRGLCYHIDASGHPGSDHGTTAIYTSTEPARFDETIRRIMSEVRSMRQRGPTEEEIKTVKASFRGYVAINVDDPMSVATSAAHGMALRGTYESPQESVAATMRVGRREAAAAARKYLSLANLGVTVVCPPGSGKTVRSTVKEIMSEVE